MPFHTQVHKARLKDGTQVAVKVQYAGLRAGVAADVATFAGLSRMAAMAMPDYQVSPNIFIIKPSPYAAESGPFTQSGRMRVASPIDVLCK